MAKKIKKGTLRLFIILTLLASIVSFPNILEVYLEPFFRLEYWRKSFSQQIRERNGISFSSQGIYLDLFRGVILKDVRIESKDSQYQFYAKDIVLKFALFSLLKQKFQFESIYVENGRLQVASYSRSALEVFAEDMKRMHQLNQNEYPNLKLPLTFHNLDISTFKKKQSDIFPPIKCDLSYQWSEDGKNFLSVTFSSENDSEALDRNWSAQLKAGSGNRHTVQFHSVPGFVLLLFLNYYDNWDIIKPLLDDLGHSNIKQLGYFSGKGTFSLPSTKQEQAGFQISMQYEGLNLNLDSDTFSPAYIRNGIGELNFRILAQKTNANFSKRKKSKQFAKTEFELAIKQKNLSLRLAKKNNQTEELSPSYYLQANLRFAPEKNLSIGNVSGALNLDIVLHQKGLYMYPQGKILAENIHLPLKRSDMKEASHDSDLHFEKISIVRNSLLEKAKLTAQAKWLQASIDLKGDGHFQFRSDPQALGTRLQLEQDLNLFLDIDSLSFHSLVDTVLDFHHSIQKEGLKIYIRKGLEIERNEFLKSKFYKSIISGLRLKAKVELSNLRSRPPLPKHLLFTVDSNERRLKVELEKLQATSSFQAAFRYALYFLGSLPKHDIDFTLALKNNQNSIPSLTGTNLPPRNFDFVYRYDGYGILPTDIVRRSYSQLRINVHQLTLAHHNLLKTIAYASGLEEQAEVELNQLFISRYTNGIQVNLNFRSWSKNLNLSGSGKYDIGVGGNVQYSVQKYFPEKRSNSQNLTLRILSSGKWVPNI